jgi:hypothetical protein
MNWQTIPGTSKIHFKKETRLKFLTQNKNNYIDNVAYFRIVSVAISKECQICRFPEVVIHKPEIIFQQII